MNDIDPAFRCPECDGSRFLDDYRTDDRVCRNCGMVVDRRISIVFDYGESKDLERHIRQSGIYKRKYHRSEREKQFLGRGPPTPDDVVAAVFDAFCELPSDAFVADSITARWVKLVLTHCGKKQYAERWVEVRYRVCAELGFQADIPRLCESELSFFEQRFNDASVAFDQLFYRAGRKRTRRDNLVGGSKDPLARHNFLNYNYVFHQIFCQLGVRRRIRAHFFFALPLTERVLNNLYVRWKSICDHYEWEAYPTAVILDPDYAQDPPLLYPETTVDYAVEQ